MPPLAELDAKYKAFKDHFAIYEQAIKGYLLLGRMLRSYDSVVTATDGYQLDRRSVAQNPDDFQVEPSVAWFNKVSRLGSTAGPSFSHLDVNFQEATVETRVEMPEIDVRVGFGPRARNNAAQFLNSTAEATMQRIGDNLRMIFPNFQFPSRIRKVEIQEEGRRVSQTKTAWQIVDQGEPLRTMIALTGLEKLSTKFKYTADAVDREKAQKVFKLSDEFKSKFCVNVGGKLTPLVKPYIELEIDPRYTLSQDVDSMLFNDRYPLNSEFALSEMPDGKSVNVSFRVRAQLVFKWPLEFAMYVTSAGSRQDFIPFMFKQYEAWHRSEYASARRRPSDVKKMKAGKKVDDITPDKAQYARAAIPDRVSHLGRITETIEERKRDGASVVPRTNDDDFTILGSAESSYAGEILWVPRTANRVSELLEQMRRTYDAENKKVDTSQFQMKNTELFTDWYFEKFSFMRVQGAGYASSDILGMSTFDLTGAVPLDSTTILRELRAPVVSDVKATGGSGKKLLESFLFEVTRFATGKFEHAKPRGDYFTEAYYNSVEKLKPLGEYFNRVARTPKPEILEEMMLFLYEAGADPKWGNLGGMPLLEFDERVMSMDPIKRTFVNSYKPVDEERMEKLRNRSGASRKFEAAMACMELLRMICEDMWAQFDRLDTAFSTKAHWLRFRLALIVKYAKESHVHEAAALEKQNKITSVDKYNTSADNIKLPNLPGIKNMMPHQAATWNVLDEAPAAALVGVAPGGGKTLISLADALKLIMRNLGKRIMVVVPNRLVRSWINEVLAYSQGQVNPIAITSVSYDTMVGAFNPNYEGSFDKGTIKQLITTTPPNSIFITDFTFLRSKAEDIIYGARSVRFYPVAHFFREMGMDILLVDESHFAKNIESNQTAAVSILAAGAKYLRELSGTIVLNTVDDLVGQSSLASPSIFGNKSQFRENFFESSGNVSQVKPEAIVEIARTMTPFIQKIDIKRHRFAFALPDMIEEFHPVSLTPKQQLFYDKWVENTLEEIKENDPSLAEKLASGNEANAGAIETGLARYFALVEQFVYAPDSVPEFQAMFAGLKSEGGTLDPEDLVSPKINMLETLLTRHFDGYVDEQKNKYEPSPYKVIIFSHRRPTSEHIMKHLPERFKKMAVRYTAGAQSALDAFEKNDKIQILVADELSINMGQNLQMAARLIRLETLWSPGNQDQAVSRIWRPDNLNADDLDVGSLRNLVHMDWIYTDRTLEVAKIGRIVSKMIDKFRYDRIEDPDYTTKRFEPHPWWYAAHGPYSSFPRGGGILQESLESMPLIIMNFETIAVMNNANALRPYFATYSLMQEFERVQFEEEKRKGNQRLIRVPDTAYVTIQGSKTLNYLPRVPGVKPERFDPKNAMGYKPISLLESEDDQEEALEFRKGMDWDTDWGPGRITKIGDKKLVVEIFGLGEVEVDKPRSGLVSNSDVNVQPGMLVDTEFGFGYIRKVQTEHVRVDIIGFKDPVRVPKATTWIISDPGAQRKVAEMLKRAGQKGLPRTIGQIQGQTPAEMAEKIQVTPVVVEPGSGSVATRPPAPAPAAGRPPAPPRVGQLPAGPSGIFPPVGRPAPNNTVIEEDDFDFGLEDDFGPDPAADPDEFDFGLDDDDFVAPVPAPRPVAPNPLQRVAPAPRTLLEKPPAPGQNAKQIRSPVLRHFDEDVDVSTNSEIHVFAEIVDGQVALCGLAADTDADLLVDEFGFKQFPAYAAIRFPLQRPDLLAKFLANIGKIFKVGPQFIENLNWYVEQMQKRRLDVAKPADFGDSVRFINVDSNRPVPEGVLRPYPVVWGDKLFVCVANPSAATQTKLRQIGRSLQLPGADPVSMQHDINLRLFRSKEAAITALNTLARSVNIPNYEQTLEKLRTMKMGGGSRRNDESEGQPSLISPRAEPITRGSKIPAPVRPAPVPAQPRPNGGRTMPVPPRGVPTPRPTAPVPAPQRGNSRGRPASVIGDEDVDFSSFLSPSPVNRGPRRR